MKYTLKYVLERSASLYGERSALSFAGEEGLRYADLYRQMKDVSRLLWGLGIRKGDRVAILSENKPNWGVAYFAITSMGAVGVPILPDFHQKEVENILAHSEAKAIFVSERLEGKTAEAGSEVTRISLEDFSLIGGNAAGAAVEEEFTDGEVEEDDLAVIIYTSGTTGKSKGVMLTHRNIVFDAATTLERVPVYEHDVLLSVLPLSHTYECTIGFLTPIMAGAHINYLRKPPVASVLLPALAQVRPTMMLSVPLLIEKVFRGKVLPQLKANALLRTLYRLPPTRKLLHRKAGKSLFNTFGGRIRFFGIGGALLAPDVELFLKEGRFPYAIGYGLTETSPLIAGAGADVTRYRSTGPALNGLDMRIADVNPSTGEGEIQVKGPVVMKGYYKDPERTAEVFTEDGYFRTGDLGVFDREGFLYIKGRLKNMILGPSGENIYPEEIEATINRSRFVLDSVVFQQGGQLVALVQFNYEELKKMIRDLREGVLEKHQQGMEFLKELKMEINSGLNAFSRISRIVEQPEPFERTPTNKIKRYLYTPRTGSGVS